MLDLGFEHSGFEISFVNEFYHHFMNGYKHSREVLKHKEPNFGCHLCSIEDFLLDSRKASLLASSIEAMRRSGKKVGFIGGPPCPDFSIGGKNKGSSGKNGVLSGSYFEIIKRYQPDFFLFENVKGLWRTKKHRAYYESLKNEMVKENYFISDKLINAMEYGSPQDRERIILLGFHRRLFGESNRREKISTCTIDFPWSLKKVYDTTDIFSLPWPQKSPFIESSDFPCPDGLIKELTVQEWFTKNDVENHPNSEHCFKPRAGLAKFKMVEEGDDSRKSSKRLHRWRYSPTACYGNNEVHLHPYKARRLSVSEALAIQSMPINFELPSSMSFSSMFKSVGNGVPYLAAKSLAKSIDTFISSLDDHHITIHRSHCF